MARPLLPDPTLKPTRDNPSAAREALRAKWREKAKVRYWSSEKNRRTKIEAVEKWRKEHPERAREVAAETLRRRRRGLTRAWRSDDAE